MSKSFFKWRFWDVYCIESTDISYSVNNVYCMLESTDIPYSVKKPNRKPHFLSGVGTKPNVVTSEYRIPLNCSSMWGVPTVWITYLYVFKRFISVKHFSYIDVTFPVSKIYNASLLNCIYTYIVNCLWFVSLDMYFLSMWYW